jgi:hypothetical protein
MQHPFKKKKVIRVRAGRVDYSGKEFRKCFFFQGVSS